MVLQTDEQTIGDLGLFSKRERNNIFDIYNRARTRGGELLLQEMFRNPLADRNQINLRSNIISAFARIGLVFPYDASCFDFAEKYLRYDQLAGGGKSPSSTPGEKEIRSGVDAILMILKKTVEFVEKIDVKAIPAFTSMRERMHMLAKDPLFTPVFRSGEAERLSYAAITAYDTLFRHKGRTVIEKLLCEIYLLDIYVAVAQVAREKKFIFPNALPKGSCRLTLRGVYYPVLEDSVTNDLDVDVSSNVILLTGANMAGKSTMLRAVSTALYIAHMGFPVAAEDMEFSVMDGLYTTINLPDNLGIGASHFYAEVIRVKKIAAELHAGKCLFVLFDELFRGTNVKDALEATVAVMKGFASKKTSIFLVSSHIVEAGQALQEKQNVSFLYMPTIMIGEKPSYSYKIERGLTDDRYGMVIIRNEGILEILEAGLRKGSKGPVVNIR